MWRFVVPAFAMMAAVLVLLAGALGDLEAWRRWPARLLSSQDVGPEAMQTARPHVPDQASRPVEAREAHAVPPPPLAPLPPAAPPLPPIPLVLASPPVAPPPATAALPVPSAAPLRPVAPQPEPAASAKPAAQPPSAPPTPAAPRLEMQQDAEAAQLQAGQIREALDRIRAKQGAVPEPPAAPRSMPRTAATQPMRQAGATQPMPQSPPHPPASVPTVAAPAETAQQSLVAARAALAMRQGEEARRLLGVAQFRILFRRPQPDQPGAMIDRRPAAAIAHAAASLDIGDYTAADRSIAFALAIMANGTVGQ